MIIDLNKISCVNCGNDWKATWLDDVCSRECSYCHLVAIFDEQFDSPTGGFYNPHLTCKHENGDLEFRCHYDNYDNEEDSWTWYYSKETNKFYN